jgi:TonB-dependent starch-binding outer membrane protein SusC
MRNRLPYRSFAASVLLGMSAACAAAPNTSAPQTRPQLTAADFRDTQESIEAIIQRKVPGMILTTNSSGDLVLRIRGKTSLQEGTLRTIAGTIPIDDPQPLYIIDGNTIRNASPLSGINRDDIETVTVLKGAEAAMYGTDALNGAIVITTKRGVKRTP